MADYDGFGDDETFLDVGKVSDDGLTAVVLMSRSYGKRKIAVFVTPDCVGRFVRQDENDRDEIAKQILATGSINSIEQKTDDLIVPRDEIVSVVCHNNAHCTLETSKNGTIDFDIDHIRVQKTFVDVLVETGASDWKKEWTLGKRGDSNWEFTAMGGSFLLSLVFLGLFFFGTNDDDFNNLNTRGKSAGLKMLLAALIKFVHDTLGGYGFLILGLLAFPVSLLIVRFSRGRPIEVPGYRRIG